MAPAASKKIKPRIIGAPPAIADITVENDRNRHFSSLKGEQMHTCRGRVTRQVCSGPGSTKKSQKALTILTSDRNIARYDGVKTLW
jgi:hypothetical protein